jgi:hypothetical protein
MVAVPLVFLLIAAPSTSTPFSGPLDGTPHSAEYHAAQEVASDDGRRCALVVNSPP